MLSYNKEKPLIAFVVPTGIGASVGGFAGDASQVARTFAKDFNVIVNPNVVNAACFSGITDNMLYVEGWYLSQFIKGNLRLLPSSNNKVGVIFDKGISQGILNVHINTINAVKTVYGIDIMGYEITEEPCKVEFYNTISGISSGSVLNNETLLKAGKRLVEKGAKTIAVVCKFEEPPEDNYQNGEGVDIVGGVEAVISHYLTRELKVPVAHSPAFEDITISKEIVDPKTAAEYITPTFLPCILIGLSNAPLISYEKGEHYIGVESLKALIMPYNALGSSIVLDALVKNIKVYAVKENTSVLNITKAHIGRDDIIEVDTYIECLEKLEEL
ncbi:TPA: DUF3326 domain-containing protein [Candidatus Avigastranaerophilus faecigallinarum]|nr:DUF3326 domain-containing protein [Candidatus Avigastranaerophilus faecigallinarum]